MKIIPVIDLLGGVTVHAKLGQRNAYRPIESLLCNSSDPLVVVGALLDVHPFDTLYIADLDAILRQGDNVSAIAAIQSAWPRLALWVDAGLSDAAAVTRWSGAGQPVLGSECLPGHLSRAELGALRELPCAALSLDFKGGRLLGPAALLDAPELWPPRVIAMTLDRVGSGLGPDIALLGQLARRAPAVQIFAAGGVRASRDLELIAASGAAGILVASALHQKCIGSTDLACFD